MRIEQLIFQGVDGRNSPARLAPSEDFSEVRLPEGVSVGDTHGLLYNLIYPRRRTEAHRDQIQGADGVKLAAILSQGGSTFRVVRQVDQSTLALQIKTDGTFETLATGPEDVDRLLEQRLGRPPAQAFHALNLWQTEPLGPAAGPEPIDLEALDRETRELAEEYFEAIEIQDVEGEIETLESEIESLRQDWGDSLDVARKLEEAQLKLEELEVADVSDDELELVRNRESRLTELEDKIDRLAKEKDRQRATVERLEPDRPYKNVWFWAGLTIAVAAVSAGVALRHSMRWIVMFDAVGFGMVTWVLLKYLTDLERANIHKVRLDSVRRRLSRVRQEAVDFREKVDHLIVHANVEDEHELLVRSKKARKLRKIVQKLEDRASDVRDDADFAEDRRRFEELKDVLERKKEQRESLPAYAGDPEYIAENLREAGVNPQRLLVDEEETQQPADSDVQKDSFVWLREVADELGLVEGGTLDERTLKLWRRLSGHVLGDAYGDVSVTGDGRIRFGGMTADQVEMWRRTRTREARAVAHALSLSMQLSLEGQKRRVETVWVEAPESLFGSELGTKFRTILQRAADRCHIALLLEE
jgi:hypothetical protein